MQKRAAPAAARFALLLSVTLLLSACAARGPFIAASLAPGARTSVELDGTPFFPQDRYQCGPASLAMALDTVLASHGLGQELRGNVLRVEPLKRLTQEAEARARLKQAREEDAPLHTWFIPVNYARAADLLPQVRSQLSPRGKASVDARTNTLIITDVAPVALP